MSLQIYDENGYVGDFATTKGAFDYLTYLRGLEQEELAQFLTEGFDLVPEALLEVLEITSVPEGALSDTHANFLSTLRQCEGIVILSDGISDDLEDAEEENV